MIIGDTSTYSGVGTTITHQPVVAFSDEDPFLFDSTPHHRLPDIVTQATLDFFYNLEQIV